MTTINKLDKIKKMANELNSYTSVSTPYYNKFKQIVQMYFKENDIKEISTRNFSTLSGLKIELSHKMLIELNSKIFQ